ncbi:MAG TPA: tRNA (adenosine(37)-N6)-threonylcarbamoyltransferase complex dimerization subunit type 1 TsaB [Thermoanaerobaculia bacterium]|nr:tRNA (adenosine(37)-N6)-threonylcarbamoyltransferase complex dimerization subunit type 1 TsaB [Thermoanaerobaculia bacterium]
MLILSIDTSMPLFSVALVSGDALVAAYAAEGKSSRNEKLLPAIDWLLAEGGIARSALDLLAVTRGPGSFTGVRIGLATIQGLAFALARPIAALSTHEAALGDAPGASSLVFADAGRDEFYATGFRGGVEDLAPSLVTAAQLDGLRGEYEERIDLDFRIRRENLALLAARRVQTLASRGADLPHDATPIYVRLAEAEVRLLRKDDA